MFQQYGSYQRQILVEDLNKKWKRVLMNNSVSYSYHLIHVNCAWSDYIFLKNSGIICVAHNTIGAL